MVSNKSPRDVDVHVGARVRVARQSRNMTQLGLAAQLRVTFQQVQKYENGTNRISVGRLHQVAVVTGMPITFFFDGVSGGDGKIDPAMRRSSEFLGTREGKLIADNFPRLGKRTRQAIFDLVKAGGGK